VITLDHVRATADPAIHRVRVMPVARKASVAMVNVAAVRRGRAWLPDAIMCGHIAVSPGALLLGRALRVPVVQYVYAKELPNRPRLARFALSRAAATIAISNHTANLAIRAGAPPVRVRRIEPGVDAAASTARVERAGRPTILTVARLTDRHKGFDVMMRAMPLVRARVPDAVWVIVGEGRLRPELEEAAAAAGLSESVQFTGSVTAIERDDWYARAHVFALPSRVPADGGGDGYGLVYLEAGARGLPCVAGDAGAVAEVVVHGESGLLVDARDHVALAEALVSLLLDPETSERLGRAGRKRAGERTWERMVRQVEDLVEQTVADWRS